MFKASVIIVTFIQILENISLEVDRSGAKLPPLTLFKKQKYGKPEQIEI